MIAAVYPVDHVQTVLATMRIVEERFGLFDLQWNGVPFWSAYRPVIVAALLQATGDAGPLQAVSALTTADRYKRLPANLTLRNPWLRQIKGRVLISRWERSQIVDGREVEQLSDAIGAMLPAEEVIYLDTIGRYRGNTLRSWSVEAVNLAVKLGRRRNALVVSGSDRALFLKIEAAFREMLGGSIDLLATLANPVQDLVVRRPLLRGLLARAGIEHVMAVVAYNQQALLLAARDLGIPVTDIQHGLLGIAYDGIGDRTDPCLPDRIALFGSAWEGHMGHRTHVVTAVVGAPHVRARLDQIAPMPREDALLVISQPMIREQLIDFAIAIAREPDAPRVIYRLHPGDDAAACRAAIAATGLSEDRLALSSGGGALGTLIAQRGVRAEVGTFSTAVLEGLALGTPSFLYPETGYSLILPAIEGGERWIVRSPADLVRRYRELPEQSDTIHRSDDLFAKADARALHRLLA